MLLILVFACSHGIDLSQTSDRCICWHWVWSSLIISCDRDWELHKLFSKCTLTLDIRSCLLEEGVVCVITFQVKDGSLALSDCVIPIRSFQTLVLCSKPNLVLDIWLIVWGRVRYFSVSEAPLNIESLRVNMEETVCFSDTWMPE